MAVQFEDMLREALRVEVPAAVRRSARGKVLAGAETILRERQAAAGIRHRPARLRMLRPAALAAAFFVLFSAGTALAATQAGPDSSLYPLRQRLEAARTTLAIQNLDKAYAEAGYANTRLDEISQMAEQGKPQYIPDLLLRYDAHIGAATSLAEKAGAEGEDTSDINEMIAATRARHDELLKSPEEPVPGESQEQAPVAGAASSEGQNHGNAPGSAGGYAGGGSGEAEMPMNGGASPEGGEDYTGLERQENHAGGSSWGDEDGNEFDPPGPPSMPGPSENDDHEPNGQRNDSRSGSHSKPPEDESRNNREQPERHQAM